MDSGFHLLWPWTIFFFFFFTKIYRLWHSLWSDSLYDTDGGNSRLEGFFFSIAPTPPLTQPCVLESDELALDTLKDALFLPAHDTSTC